MSKSFSWKTTVKYYLVKISNNVSRAIKTNVVLCIVNFVSVK